MRKIASLFIACLQSLMLTAQTDSITISRPWNGYGWGYGPILFHEGLNVDLSLAAFASFGKNSQGGGFAQSLSATYVQPLDEKVWVAAGAGVSNTMFCGHSYRSGALYGILGYRFDEHWEAALYGMMSVGNHPAPSYAMPANRFLPYSAYAYGPYGLPYGMGDADRIGGMVTYHFNPSFSVSLSVEKAWYDGFHSFPLPDRHANPRE